MSMALISHRHRSPVMSALCTEWYSEAKDDFHDADDEDKMGAGGQHDSRTAKQSFNLARNRWHLAYTLLNNPQVIPYRGSAVSLETDEDEVNSQGSAGSGDV